MTAPIYSDSLVPAFMLDYFLQDFGTQGLTTEARLHHGTFAPLTVNDVQNVASLSRDISSDLAHWYA